MAGFALPCRRFPPSIRVRRGVSSMNLHDRPLQAPARVLHTGECQKRENSLGCGLLSRSKLPVGLIGTRDARHGVRGWSCLRLFRHREHLETRTATWTFGYMAPCVKWDHLVESIRTRISLKTLLRQISHDRYLPILRLPFRAKRPEYPSKCHHRLGPPIRVTVGISPDPDATLERLMRLPASSVMDVARGT
jgi:hypothetical protein